MSRRVLAVGAVALGGLLAGCGDTAPEVRIDAGTDEQREIGKAIEEELNLYREPIDLSSLPPDQQAQLGEALDQFPQAAGIVSELAFEGDAVIAASDLEEGGNSETTARLICGAIIRGSEDPRAGHEVLASDGEVLARCRPSDANYP